MRKERRLFTRVQLEVPANLYLFQAEVKHTGSILDLGNGGCFFHLAEELSPGEPCQITFTLGEGLKTETVGLTGTIVRTSEQGVGIQFCDTSAENSQRLLKILSIANSIA